VLYHIKDLSTINGVIRPGIVHRLDKDTSGLIVVAKNDVAHVKLTEMFKDKTIEKRYLCICKGNFKNIKGRIETLIGRDPKDRKKMAVVTENGKVAITNYEVVDSVDNFSLVEVGIETGRTHQIRVHMKSLNHPILGDSTYGNSDNIAKRQMLHSYYLKFNHPITNEELIIVGDLKEDFKSVAKRLKLDIKKVSRLNK
ncbi:MAG: RluA family pseudouridine synthase, partial [Cetobacterium sp.]